MQLNEEQVKAVELCLDRSKRIVAITGAAGTGKTTVIKTVLEQLDGAVLAAPTGKAARGATQVTGKEAVTIHRLLEFPMPGEFDEETGKPLQVTVPKRNRMDPLTCNTVLCDEFAMAK